MAEGINELTDSNFEAEVLKSSQPTLVDFWAEWCAPCRALTPVIEEIAKDYEGQLQVAKMDIDAHRVTPGKYSVMSIPTLLLFKDGDVVEQTVGLVSKAKLNEMITKHI